MLDATTVVGTHHSSWSRTWWILLTVGVAGILEILEWRARLWSSFSLSYFMPFQMQIVCTIIAPTPLSAASFIMLGRVIQVLGPQYSRLSTKAYSIIFLTCDTIASVFHGIGRGKASATDGDLAKANIGGNIMLGGIVFQLGNLCGIQRLRPILSDLFSVAITLYLVFFADLVYRYIQDKPVSRISFRSGVRKNCTISRGKLTRKLKAILGALVLEAVPLFIRAVYSDGWTGRIISTEVYFNVLDGAMIPVLAMYTLNFAHPGLLISLPKETDDQRTLRNVEMASSHPRKRNRVD
ncbi:RTA1-like protein [Hymenopellis radicata]|nr:RTA1-like protein [Hymenopellis radicata]